MFFAPASKEFSMSSLTALHTLVTTWLLLRRLTVSWGRATSSVLVMVIASENYIDEENYQYLSIYDNTVFILAEQTGWQCSPCHPWGR